MGNLFSDLSLPSLHPSSELLPGKGSLNHLLCWQKTSRHSMQLFISQCAITSTQKSQLKYMLFQHSAAISASNCPLNSGDLMLFYSRLLKDHYLISVYLMAYSYLVNVSPFSSSYWVLFPWVKHIQA